MPAKAGIHALPARPHASNDKNNKSASFFEKKEAKKLLLLRALAPACHTPR
jgi:hypothetical protein